VGRAISLSDAISIEDFPFPQVAITSSSNKYFFCLFVEAGSRPRPRLINIKIISEQSTVNFDSICSGPRSRTIPATGNVGHAILLSDAISIEDFLFPRITITSSSDKYLLFFFVCLSRF
jgi:hypothetical protein